MAQINYTFLLLQYLLAMVYVYFRRAELPLEAYNRTNFFIALYVGGCLLKKIDIMVDGSNAGILI